MKNIQQICRNYYLYAIIVCFFGFLLFYCAIEESFLFAVIVCVLKLFLEVFCSGVDY